MYDNYIINRCDAMEWLAKSLVDWPSEISGSVNEMISVNDFSVWCFINTIVGDVVFTDLISPGISEADFYNFLHDYAGTEITRFGDDDEDY